MKEVNGMAAIMVLTAGSTGDVEPFAVLAGVLARRGHAVTLAADAKFEPLAPGSLMPLSLKIAVSVIFSSL